MTSPDLTFFFFLEIDVEKKFEENSSSSLVSLSFRDGRRARWLPRYAMRERAKRCSCMQERGREREERTTRANFDACPCGRANVDGGEGKRPTGSAVFARIRALFRLAGSPNSWIISLSYSLPIGKLATSAVSFSLFFFSFAHQPQPSPQSHPPTRTHTHTHTQQAAPPPRPLRRATRAHLRHREASDTATPERPRRSTPRGRSSTLRPPAPDTTPALLPLLGTGGRCRRRSTTASSLACRRRGTGRGRRCMPGE